MVGQDSITNFDANSAFNDYKYLFTSMAYSLVIASKWEK